MAGWQSDFHGRQRRRRPRRQRRRGGGGGGGGGGGAVGGVGAASGASGVSGASGLLNPLAGALGDVKHSQPAAGIDPPSRCKREQRGRTLPPISEGGGCEARVKPGQARAEVAREVGAASARLQLLQLKLQIRLRQLVEHLVSG